MHAIREWRKKNRVTLEDLGSHALLSQPSLSRIETGATTISGDTALVLSQLTGIDVYALRPDLKVSDERKQAFRQFLKSNQSPEKKNKKRKPDAPHHP